MATLALSVAGQFAGALVGGPFGATIGRALGALAGSVVDGWLFGEKAEAPVFDVRLGGSAEGGAIPRLYGWGRLGGNIIWARELERLGGEQAGAKGLMPQEDDEEIGASFAIGFCEGPVARLGRIWADGQLLDTRGLTLRFYHGDAAQLPDGLIEATQGVGQAPAYRGLCYLVVENLPLSRFGNRIPQISAELCRVVGELEPAISAVTVIPGATEFGYDPVPRVRMVGRGAGVSENAHLLAGVSNWSWSIDELQALCPNLEHVALVVTWFGDDLRCGECKVTPRVEAAGRSIEGTEWSVAGLGRSDVPVVSQHNGGPAYGGTPSDDSVLAAISDLKARGLKVTLYPLMMMDVPAGNGLPDPYGGGEQANYPWRGRMTCFPAAGIEGSPDGTGMAAAQVAAFVPGYRDMVLHYAGLASAAGGVEALLIGSEMRALTTVRGEGNSFPFVEALVTLAADVRAIVGPEVKLSYAADWSEYSGHQPDGQKFFHLDPLWASQDIDAVGIDCYMPLADWRDGENHLDRAISANGYELGYLGGNVAGGEGFDWYYASDADRQAQRRTPIVDGAYGEDWVWRYKDIAAFWGNAHYNRPGGVRDSVPTAWVPGSKPIWLTELGCGAVDKGANQPNIFGDDKSAEGGRPYFSSGQSDALIQRQFLRAHFRHWADATKNPPGMVDAGRIFAWTWDARPYPAFPAQDDVWADGPNHRTGHWLTGRLGALASDELVGAVASEHGCTLEAVPAAPLVTGLLLEGPSTAREAVEPVLEIAGLRLKAEGAALVAQAQGGTGAALDRDELAEIDAPVVSRRRGAATERASRLGLGFLDRSRDYLAASATAIRPGTGPLETRRLPMVLDDGSARQAAERLLDAKAGEDDRLELALPPNRLDLEVGDRIGVVGLAEGPFEIVEIRDGLARRLTARVVSAADAKAVGGGRAMTAPALPPAAVSPHVVLAHLPLPAGEGAGSRLVIGAYADPWPGMVRIEDAASGGRLLELSQPAALGEVMSPLAPGPVHVWDRGNALEIVLYRGHLADVDEQALFSGANRLAVETDSGDWEVIGFAEATLVAPGRYRLTGLLRGLDGTEAAMAPASAGRSVMVLDGRVGTMAVDPQWIGDGRALRCFAGGTDLVGQELAVAFGTTAVLPLSPVHLRVRRSESGAITIGWIRRSRADAGNWGLAEPPLDTGTEAYRVSIRSGGSIVRTMTTLVAEAVYELAAQVTDFGGAATDFGIEVAQVSPAFGPGPALTGGFADEWTV
ncbi:MAG: hypothetical protein ABT14_06365 [Pelagibacterium sp. SCN 63-17]|nr:MAG: hypothetical protein ABT14_06365 [Pelagibacterium sp. SCN 63-17]